MRLLWEYIKLIGELIGKTIIIMGVIYLISNILFDVKWCYDLAITIIVFSIGLSIYWNWNRM